MSGIFATQSGPSIGRPLARPSTGFRTLRNLSVRLRAGKQLGREERRPAQAFRRLLEVSRRDRSAFDAHGGLKLSCVDCHGGNAKIEIAQDVLRPGDPEHDKVKRQADLPVEAGELVEASGNPEAPAPRRCGKASTTSASSTPATSAPRGAACGPCHNTEEIHRRSRPHQHDGPRRDALGRGDVQQRRDQPENADLRREPTTPMARPPRGRQTAADHAAVRQDGHCSRICFRCRAGRSPSRATSCACSSAAARSGRRSGCPIRCEDAGQAGVKLSVRGFGTDVRTDPVFIGLQKTRLLDPTLNFFGTNDHPGDYRASGCTACHVVYANDRSPRAQRPTWAKLRQSRRELQRIPRSTRQPPRTDRRRLSTHAHEAGHPIKHRFVKTCRPARASSATFTPARTSSTRTSATCGGTTRPTAKLMYPKKQQYPTPEHEFNVNAAQPRRPPPRGLVVERIRTSASRPATAGKDFLENSDEHQPS